MRGRVACALVVAVLGAGLALAWNPLVQRSSGALRWSTASAVTWNPDGGTLGKWSNATAITEVDAAFTTWQNVGFSVITYTQGGQIEDGGASTVDVTSANYDAIIALNNGQNPIIFDNDRDIFDHLGIPNGVLGFAGTLITDGSGTILKGYAVLQGDWFDNDSGDVGEITGNEFRGMFVHEFGHFSGLGPFPDQPRPGRPGRMQRSHDRQLRHDEPVQLRRRADASLRRRARPLGALSQRHVLEPGLDQRHAVRHRRHDALRRSEHGAAARHGQLHHPLQQRAVDAVRGQPGRDGRGGHLPVRRQSPRPTPSRSTRTPSPTAAATRSAAPARPR